MNPLELAKVFFSGISAVAAAVQAWYRFKDRQKAADAFDTTYRQTLDSREANEAATELVAIIPEAVIEDLEHRADKCWTGYRDVLGGEYLPFEIDKATDDVQACVCRELGRMNKLSGTIPAKWEGQWNRFNCEGRDRNRNRVEPLSFPPHHLGQHDSTRTSARKQAQ